MDWPQFFELYGDTRIKLHLATGKGQAIGGAFASVSVENLYQMFVARMLEEFVEDVERINGEDPIGPEDDLDD